MSQHRTAAVYVAAMVLCLAANIGWAASGGTLNFEQRATIEVQNRGNRTLSVTRTGGSRGEAGAVCTAASGTAVLGKDFTMAATSLQWTNGDATAKHCVVTILDNKPYHGDKSFVLELRSVTGATVGLIGKETITIVGNLGGGSMELSSAKYSVSQSAGRATLTVERTGGTTGEAVVYYSTANGTAIAGKTYTHTAGRLLWKNGDATAKAISIPISASDGFSGSKTFAVALAYPENAVLGTRTCAIVTITGEDTESTAALLTWSPPSRNTNGTAVTPLAGYTVHYGTTQGALNHALVVEGASTTSYELTGLTRATWYFAISANAKDGTKGPLSSIGSKTILGGG